MPNWCSNYLKITGPKEDLDALVAKVKGPALDWNGDKAEESEKQAFCFENVVPYPPELKGADYSDVVYRWQLNNWGCKWGVQDAQVTRLGDEELSIYMSTPWGPAPGMLTALSKLFPSLLVHLTYDEMGMDFAGEAEWKGGKMVSEETYEGDKLHAYFREAYPALFEDDEEETDEPKSLGQDVN